MGEMIVFTAMVVSVPGFPIIAKTSGERWMAAAGQSR
jgi:hypothetical protein